MLVIKQRNICSLTISLLRAGMSECSQPLVCVWAFTFLKGGGLGNKTKNMEQRLSVSLSLKYLLHGPIEKKLADL